jgi:hypothetical protein
MSRNKKIQEDKLKPLQVYLDEIEKAKVRKMAKQKYKVTMSGYFKKLMRKDFEENKDFLN